MSAFRFSRVAVQFPKRVFNFCEICSGAYVYVMTTNWFRLMLNAAIQLPSGPSVSVCLYEA